jgi:DnaK suppressor protein
VAPPLRPPTRAHVDEDTESPDLTPEQREELRTQIEEMRARLVQSIAEHQHQESELGREIGDEMDEASLEGSTAMSSRLLERNVQLLAEIDRALVKFRDGTYGICDATGEPIGYERLRSRPWARYSIRYQEELERQVRTGGR